MEKIDRPQIDEIIELMKQYDSINYSLEFSKKYCNEAKESIENFSQTNVTKSLQDIADFVVSRQL